MKNNRLLFSTSVILLISALALISCTQTADRVKEASAPRQESHGLWTDNGDPGLTALAEKLRNSNTRRTHILVLGDSHTAADFLSGQLRQAFQEKYGNGGIGFVSPMAVPGNRYNNVSYGKTKNWKLENSRRLSNPGFTLGGNIATPLTGSSDIQVDVRDGEAQIQAQVLYRSQGAATLQLQQQPLALGDTQGHWALSDAAQVPSSFSLSLADGGGAQLAGLWLTSAQPHGVIVSALGTNGAQISILDKWHDNWGAVLNKLAPDLVILAYGTNEAFNTDIDLAEYQRNLTRQIRIIRQMQPDAAVLLVGPGSSVMNKKGADCSQRESPVLQSIIDIQKQVAQNEHTLFWDWYAWMGGRCSIERLANQGKARPDLIHLTAEGYQATANALWQDLMSAVNAR